MNKNTIAKNSTVTAEIGKVTKELTSMGNPRPIFHTTSGVVINGAPNLMRWYGLLGHLQNAVADGPTWMSFQTDGWGRATTVNSI